jgi:hypothetical protein
MCEVAKLSRVHSGHGPVTPQQIAPQASPPMGPAAAQVSPDAHAGCVPQRHVPLSQCSPAAQQAAPHAGPSGQPPDEAHDPAGASVPASVHVRWVQLTPVSVHVQELQPSPTGNVSPTAYVRPWYEQEPPLS